MKEIFWDEKKKTLLIAALVFLIAFGVYLKTLAPSIWFEDSGELTTSPYTLGITHPSGYPLYTVVNKVVMTLLPVGNIGFRGNLANAYWAALAIMMIYLIVLKMEKNLIRDNALESDIFAGGHLPAIVAALLTAFIPMVWLYAITSEEYALNFFMMMLLTWLFLVWEEKRDIRYMFMISLIYGISFSNHHKSIFFFIPFLYFGSVTDWRSVYNWKNFLTMFVLFTLGFGFYAYMPIRSAQHPYLNWGTPYLWEGFKFSLFRQQYTPIRAFREIKRLFSQLNMFGIIEQFNIYIFFFSLLGMWRMITKNLKYSIYLLLITLFSGIGFVCFINPPNPGHMFNLLRKFYLPLYAVCAIWITFGMSFVLEKIYMFASKVKPINPKAWIAALIIFSLTPLTNLFTYYKEYDYKKVYFTYDFVYNMANSIEKNSVVWGFLSNDTFTWWYYKYSEGRRPDIVNIHQRMITLPWYYQQTLDNYPNIVMTHNEFLQWNLRQDLVYRSVIFTKDLMRTNPNRNYYYTFFSKGYLPRKYNLNPKGIVFRDYGGPYDAPLDEEVWMNYRYRGMDIDKVPRSDRANDVIRFAKAYHVLLGRKYMSEEKFNLAIYQYQIIAKLDPKSGESRYSLGYSYYRLNKPDSAVREFKKFLKIDPTSPEAKRVKVWLNGVKLKPGIRQTTHPSHSK